MNLFFLSKKQILLAILFRSFLSWYPFERTNSRCKLKISRRISSFSNFLCSINCLIYFSVVSMWYGRHSGVHMHFTPPFRLFISLGTLYFECLKCLQAIVIKKKVSIKKATSSRFDSFFLPLLKWKNNADDIGGYAKKKQKEATTTITTATAKQ